MTMKNEYGLCADRRIGRATGAKFDHDPMPDGSFVDDAECSKDGEEERLPASSQTRTTMRPRPTHQCRKQSVNSDANFRCEGKSVADEILQQRGNNKMDCLTRGYRTLAAVGCSGVMMQRRRSKRRCRRGMRRRSPTTVVLMRCATTGW